MKGWRAGEIRVRALVALVILCFLGLAIQPVCADDSTVMWEFGQKLSQQHPEIAKMTNSGKAKFMFSEYCKRLDESGQGVNVDYWDRVLETGNQLQSDRWTCGDHLTKLKYLFAAAGVTGIVEIISDDIDGSHGLNSMHTTIAVVDETGEVYTFDPWMMAKTNMDKDQARYTGYPYKWASNNRFNGMPVDDYTTWMLAPHGENYKRFSTDIDEPRTYYPTVREAVNAKLKNTTLPPQKKTPVQTDCQGCDIRTLYEIQGEDMHRCDACPNDERKKSGR